MGKSLKEIAQELIKENREKVQLIYAFNGTGKTRLSREFKELFSPQQEQNEEVGETKMKVIYYNAFTEDLFHWDNDLYTNRDRKLIIIPNSFTGWVFTEDGQEENIISNFQRYTNDKLTPKFHNDYKEVTFSIEAGNQEPTDNIKISRGEESCFIWCIFYSLFQQIVGILNIAEKGDRSTNKFNDLEYIFIDDPVSSLDENHLIEMAVNIAELIKSSESNLKFVITTHNPLFYNILYSELGVSEGYLLRKNEDQTLEFEEKKGDSNQSFSYHLFLKKTLEEAIKTNSVQKYHFTLLRNLYEKTANFLGYPRWAELLPDDKQLYYRRIIQFTSHSTLSNDTIAEPTDPEKQIIKFLLEHLVGQYQFKQN